MSSHTFPHTATTHTLWARARAKSSHRAQVTSDTAVAVNAGPSYDPDEESGSLAFRWLCGRSDGLDCRTAEGALLPTRMTNSSLAGVKLQAVVGDSLCYTFTLSVSKGARVASTSTTVSASSCCSELVEARVQEEEACSGR